MINSLASKQIQPIYDLPLEMYYIGFSSSSNVVLKYIEKNRWQYGHPKRIDFELVLLGNVDCVFVSKITQSVDMQSPWESLKTKKKLRKTKKN